MPAPLRILIGIALFFLLAYGVPLAVKRFLDKHPESHERLATKGKLPPGVRAYEILAMLFFWFLTAFICFWVATLINGIIHPGLIIGSNQQQAFVGVSFVASFFFIGIPSGMILSNLIGQIIPVIRDAEMKAYEGVPGGTYYAMQSGLLKAAALVVPIGLVAIIVTVILA